VLCDHVGKEAGPLLGCRPGAERLADRVDVVVDGLRKPDHREAVLVLRQERRQVRGRGIRVVAADRVQDVDAVLDELVGRDLLGILVLLDEAPLHAVLHIGELHPAVADRAASVAIQDRRLGAHLRGHPVAVPEEQALVAAAVGDDLDIGRDLRVALDEPAYGGAQAGG